MKKETSYWVVGIVLFIIIFFGIIAKIESSKNKSSPEVDAFAQCLTEKGAIFYGAFWCPHCQNQKKLFGGAVQYIKYVECSLPNGKGRTQACIDKKIEGYPTWEFADGLRQGGELSFDELSEKTGCPVPVTDSSSSSPRE